MKTIFNMILLAASCLPTSVLAVQDTIPHQPMTETPVALNEVVVTGLTGSQRLKDSPAPVSVISAKQLEAQSSSNLIDAIAHEPGVSQVTTGSGISKPVIRGLGYNRVVVVQDGIRQEGQQWGDEHGVDIDANSVGSVEILKGPASLMYGSDAMAGVLLFHSAPTLPLGKVTANVSTEYQTNNHLWGYSLNSQGNLGGIVWNSRYSGKTAGDYTNRADGRVPGSDFREQAFSQLIGLNRRWGHSHLTLSYYHIKPGIVEGERDETTGRLLSETPFQQVHHYKAVLDNAFYIGESSLKLLLGYQQNRRQEFEEADECGLDFLLHTLTYDVRWLSPVINGWRFATGVGGMYQRSLNRGEEYLIPAYRLFDYGLYATASRTMGRWSVSGGLRYDHRRLHSERLEEDDEERFSDFRRDFQGVTGSIGLTCDLLPNLSMKLNLARGFRAPNLSELGANGEHEGTARYELGNHDLKAEHSWQLDWGMDFSSKWLSARLALFVNRIGNYVFSGRQTNEKGEPILIDGVAVYRFMQGDARLMGGEAEVDLHPTRRLHVGNSFSLVDAVQLHQPRASRYLPLTPAPRWNADVRYEFICDEGHTLDNLFVKFAMECNLRQSRFYAEGGTETATPSYTLLSFHAGTDIRHSGVRRASLYLSCENLTNRNYQSHLSRLKYMDINAVTGRQGVFNMGRNFVIKLVVPFIWSHRNM